MTLLVLTRRTMTSENNYNIPPNCFQTETLRFYLFTTRYNFILHRNLELLKQFFEAFAELGFG